MKCLFKYKKKIIGIIIIHIEISKEFKGICFIICYALTCLFIYLFVIIIIFYLKKFDFSLIY